MQVGRRIGAALLERVGELAEVGARWQAAATGRGGVVVVEGLAGIGKSRLLDEACAAAAGGTVVRARAGELEQDYPWGVARQLLDRVVGRAEPRRRAALLAGAAAMAREPLGLVAGDASPDDASFAARHGLYWLCVALAEDAPLLLCVDDAQWADAPSVRFLHFLGTRIADLPVLVLAARRPLPPPPEHDLATLPAAITVRPAPLSEAAVAMLVTTRFGAPGPAFVRACHRVTGGNPFLLAELLAGLGDVAPSDAEAPRLGRLGPRTVAHAVLRRIAPLGAEPMALARAVAVLGTGADVRHAAAVAGIDAAAAARAADVLAAAEVLSPGRPLEFVHPIVRAAVRDNLATGERAALHSRAAEALAEAGAPGERVAVHLLATEPGGQSWVAEQLHAAAVAALGRGAPDSASAMLRRALAEPAPAASRPAVLRLLGRCALLDGDDAGAEYYRSAIEATTDLAERAAMARELGVIHVPPGDYPLALATLESAVADARAAGETELATLSEADLLCAAWLHPDGLQTALARGGAIDPDTVAPTPAGRCLLGALAFHGVVVGWPVTRIAELASRAVSGALPADPTTSNALWNCGVALNLADELTAARTWWDAIMTSARARGSILTFARCSAFTAQAALRAGDLPEAEAHARASVEATEGQRWFLRRMATAWLVEALLERGAQDAAVAALEAVDGDGELPDAMMTHYLRYARARLRVTRGDLDGALADLEAFGTSPGSTFADNPAAVPWRSAAALIEHALGRTDRARELVVDELDRARHVASDRAVGVALRARGLVEGSIELLVEAATILERSPARLERARALVDLGAALRRAGRRTACREPLTAGMDLAHACGATPLVERARDELRAAGARPRRYRSTGVAALTASERRVAEMAARGMTNRDIAQALFVTLRTVEVHLTHAYTKLGITARTELARAFSTT